MRILLVDDDMFLREVLTRRLLHWKHEVVAAESGREAFRVLSEWKFDAVITDMEMFDGTGMDLLARMEADPDLHIPTYVHSSEPYFRGVSLETVIPGHFPFAEFHLKNENKSKPLKRFLDSVELKRCS